MPRVLIIDDEPNMRWVLQEALGAAGYETAAAGSGEEALSSLAAAPVDLAILDLKLRGMDGLSTLRQIHQRWPAVVVLILTAYGTVATAVEAMQSGAADYLRKPFDVEEVLFKVSRSLERHTLQAELGRLRAAPPPPLPGGAPSWRRAVEAAVGSAGLGLDLRLVGEPGSGRAGLGRAAHQSGIRRAAPLVELDLASMPAAAQGALLAGDGRAEGFWGAAGQGALLLRHIEQLSPAGVAALAGLLEQRGRAGVGPQLILTGTAEGWARAPQLAHRYAEVRVPPLREHLDDLMPFVAAWLPDRPITAAAGELLHGYAWPGNLGELRGVVERAALLAAGGPIDERHLPERVRAAPLPGAPFRLPAEGLVLEDVEISLIQQALERAGGNKTRAAELLGLTRHTLLYRLEKYKIGDGS